MTVVCAWRRGPDVWIASDSRMASGGGFVPPVGVRKWHAINGWHIGHAGAWRFDALLRSKPHKFDVHSTVYEVADHLRHLIIDDHWKAREPESGPLNLHQEFLLIAPDSHVYEVGPAGGVTDMEEEFVAIGSGYDYAYGAVFALSAIGEATNPAIALRVAVQAAIKFDVGCGGREVVEFVRGAVDQERAIPRFENAAS